MQHLYSCKSSSPLLTPYPHATGLTFRSYFYKFIFLQIFSSIILPCLHANGIDFTRKTEYFLFYIGKN